MLAELIQKVYAEMVYSYQIESKIAIGYDLLQFHNIITNLWIIKKNICGYITINIVRESVNVCEICM